MANKRGKRLNLLSICAFCRTKVNPYVIMDDPKKTEIEVECPNCENKFKAERNSSFGT